MTFTQACFLFLAATVGGMLNAVAGGGGFIIFPSLIFTGLSSISANATGTIAAYAGSIASLVAYRQELLTQQRLSLLFGSVSLVGGLLGALLLLSTPSVVFDQLVPYLLLFATLMFTFSDSISTRLPIAIEETGNWHSLLKASFIQFLIAVYGGFYGLGISFLMLATLGMLGMKDMHKMNALKMLLFVCIDAFAVIAFAIAKVVAWQQAVVIMVGTVVGGYSGAYYSRQLKPQLIRRFVIALGLGMSCYFFLQAAVSTQ